MKVFVIVGIILVLCILGIVLLLVDHSDPFNHEDENGR